MSELEAGELLGGKFVIEGVLGRGGMGIVYAARHTSLDQRVAIKCLLPDAMHIPAVVERFAREARAAAKIQGEHVTRVLDVGTSDDGIPFIVMEYMQGHDLADELMLQGVIQIADAVRYVLQACEALAQAHALRIVHRDLKPSNLFLAETPGRRPFIKVLDFGISKMVDPNGVSITKTSSMMGTPFYMSPEQLLSAKSVDERSDIWALGIILYELLTGSPPFTAETGPEIIAMIVQNAPRAPRDVRPEIPAELEAIILRCLKTKVDERFVNVGELAVALGPFAEPADRSSIDAIAKVIGDSGQNAPAGSVVPAVTRPAPLEPSGASAPAFAATVITDSPDERAMPTGVRPADVVDSSPSSQRRTSPMLVAIAGLTLLGIGGAAFAFHHPAEASRAHGSTRPSTTAHVPNAGEASAAAPPATGTATSAEASPPLAADPTVAVNRAGPANASAAASPVRPVHAPGATAASATPSASAPAASEAPVKPPPPQHHSPPPSSSKNPLDIQIQ